MHNTFKTPFGRSYLSVEEVRRCAIEDAKRGILDQDFVNILSKKRRSVYLIYFASNLK